MTRQRHPPPRDPAASLSTSEDSGSVAFELPRADEVPLWDFYCRPQPRGGDAVSASLAESGASLRAQLEKLAHERLHRASAALEEAEGEGEAGRIDEFTVGGDGAEEMSWKEELR